MKRRNFLTASALSVPALTLSGFVGDASPKTTLQAKGFFIRASESRFDGKQKIMNGDLLRCVIASNDADGKVLMGTTMPASLQHKVGRHCIFIKTRRRYFL